MSILAIDIIDRLPFEYQARLQADDYFSDIPVIVAEEGDVKQMLQKKQAVITTKGGKRGVAVIVLPMAADDHFRNLGFGPMTLRPAFEVIENLELNRGANGTWKSARKVARRIRDVVKNAGLVGLVKDVKPENPCIVPVPLVKELGDLVKAYQVNFQCLEVSTEKLSQVQIPVIEPTEEDTAEFQITCPTDGAEIWYTTDDSYPAPTRTNPDSTAKVYAAPIAIPDAGVMVRACAYKAGSVASWVQRALVELE